MEEALAKGWQYILAGIAAVMWFARLENRVTAIERQADRDRDDAKADRAELKEMVRKVDEKLDRVIERQTR